MTTKIVRKKISEKKDDPTIVAPAVPIIQSNSEVLLEKRLDKRDYILCVTKKILDDSNLFNPFIEDSGFVFTEGWVQTESELLAAKEDEPLVYYLGKENAVFVKKIERTIEIPKIGYSEIRSLRLPFIKNCIGTELSVHINYVNDKITEKTLYDIIDDQKFAKEENKIIALASDSGWDIKHSIMHPRIMFAIINLEKNEMLLDSRLQGSKNNGHHDDLYAKIFYPAYDSCNKWLRSSEDNWQNVYKRGEGRIYFMK